MISSRWRLRTLVAAVLVCVALPACTGTSTSAGSGDNNPTTTSGAVPASGGISPGQLAVAKDGAKNDYFGGDFLYDTSQNPVKPLYYASPGEVAMSADGKYAIVGDPGHAQGTDVGAGAAFVYVETKNGHWVQQAELSLADHVHYEEFGWAVTISDDGTTAVVGAPYHSSPGKVGDGAAYVFHRVGATWTQTAQLVPPAGASYDALGWSFAISGATAPYTVLVGAPSHAAGNAKSVGVVYAFVGSGASWALRSTITSPDAAPEGAFGTAVALAAGGTTAVITKFDHTNANVHHIGATYVYKSADGWATSKVAQSFQDPNRNADGSPDGYGTDVGLSADGQTAMVAAPDVFVGPTGFAGALYVYTTGSDWASPATSHTSTIAEPNAQQDGYYGSTVEVDAHGTTAVVGADDIGSDGQGGLFLLKAGPATSPTRWSASSVVQTLIPAPDPVGPGRLGTDVGMSNDGKKLVGTAPFVKVGANVHQGAAYFFTVR